jgi:hypothetical protein
MPSIITNAARTALAATLFALPFAPLAARAQAAPAAPPSYAHRNTDETVKGRIENFDGHYHLTVRDQRGFIDNIELHQGTIINPTGLTLQKGMAVTVIGHNEGNALAANEIDTPYHYEPGLYPYGYYGYPGYDFALGFGFGGYGRFGYGRFGRW